MPRQFETPDVAGGPFRLGEWLVEPSLNRVSRGDTTIQLELKVMDVLVCLAERAGEVVTRFEIIDRVWATEFIADNTLTHAINEIRTALGDDARNPSFIETIHRRGYRLMVPVTLEERPVGTIAQFPSQARPGSGDERSPYPGLAAFTEADAEFFFGREAEVAQMWRKLTSRRLLAVIGPSGVGKSSFLRAGVIPAAPEGWGILICQPGEAPFAALARALLPEFAGDFEATARLVHLQEPGEAVAIVSRWHERHDQALLIVDQFEELFTLNPTETQERFAELLRRLVDEADIHVLLAMRDDFLYRCNAQPALRPIFEDLTPLEQPNRASLRRALVEPAVRLGSAFENDDLVDAMLDEVSDERSALPLLAFAMARLWETRDRDRRLLTRAAYHDIGGVGGALARHAEATLRAIGEERRPLVRELFRNLVTAEGTRAARSLDDLLSVFPEERREDATEVLRRLIDARLLTSFEDRGLEDDRRDRVEIVHESLLTAWPRLVGWQTQDADSARLRDELRQAAKAWEEHDRPDDWLWVGAQYREFASWRERYPGGLSKVEEDFAVAMTNHGKRRRRSRRVAAAAALLVSAALALVFGTLWRQGQRHNHRAEAQKLIAIGQLELADYPSATVAHAIASLELDDSSEARQLAQEALWRGPTALVTNDESSWHVAFTPDGRSLVQSGDGTGRLRIINSDGTSTLLEHKHRSTRINIWMGIENDVFCSYGFSGEPSLPLVGLWSVSEARRLGHAEYDGPTRLFDVAISANQQRMVYLIFEEGEASVDVIGFDGGHDRLGNAGFSFGAWRDWWSHTDLETVTGRGLGAVVDGDVWIVDIDQGGLSEPLRIGRHNEPVSDTLFDPLGRFFATVAMDGGIRLWDLGATSPPTVLEGPPGSTLDITADGSLLEARVIEDGVDRSWVWSLDSDPPRLLRKFDLGPAGIGGYFLDSVGRQFAKAGPDLKVRLWPLGRLAGADPVVLSRGEVVAVWSLSFHPTGRLLASADKSGLSVWPLSRPYPIVIQGHEKMVFDLVFDPEGRWLASSSMDHTVRLWPLEGDVPAPGRILLNDPGKQMYDLASTPSGEQLLVGTGWSGFRLVSTSGKESPHVPHHESDVYGTSISPDGRLAAGALGVTNSETRILVWDLASGKEVTVLRPEGQRVFSVHFTEDGHLLTSSEIGLRRWNLETGENELLCEGNLVRFAANSQGNQAIAIEGDRLDASAPKRAIFFDLDTGETRPLETHGARVSAVAFDYDNNVVVTADQDGVVRVGSATGEEPYLLAGHERAVYALAIDPMGRWVASGDQDGNLRLWPIPDLSKPPLHTLPREELIAKLKTLTNLRVVRDEDSPTGWKLAVGRFPGWETVPEW